MEKLDNLKKLIDEKDTLIKDLAEKIRVLEEDTYEKEDTMNENEESESEMDKTFLNPYLVNKGDSCNFVAKHLEVCRYISELNIIQMMIQMIQQLLSQKKKL